MRVVFVDKLTVGSVCRLLWRLRSCEKLYYFDLPPSTERAKRLIKWLRGVRWTRADVCQVEDNVGSVRDVSGESSWMELRNGYRQLGRWIRTNDFPRNATVQALSAVWDGNRIAQHFHKLIERDLFLEFSRIDMVQWIARAVIDVPLSDCVLCIGRRPWLNHLKHRARSVGVGLISYCSFWQSDTYSRQGRVLFAKISILWQLVVGRLRAGKHSANQRQPAPAAASSPSAAKATVPGEQVSGSYILIKYEHGSLSFDKDARSQWFYFHEADLPYSQVILHGLDPDYPPDDRTLQELGQRGIRLDDAAPGSPGWRPSMSTLRRLLVSLLKFGWRLPFHMVRHLNISPVYVREACKLVVQYVAWYEYYAAHSIHINIDSCHGHVGQTLALDELGGVSFAYQYSSSQLVSVGTHGAGEDVLFVFSDLYEKVYRDVLSSFGRYLRVGYLYDRAIRNCTRSNRLGDIRDQLLSHGAEFVICFFDENSADRWWTWESSQHAGKDYEYLLNWLLEDPTLGVVFKPKRAATLLKRMGHIETLIRQAEATGRCRIVNDPLANLVDRIFPAEVALIADLSIGKIRGATASLEAALAGCRSVLLRIGISEHPLLDLGRGHVVFDNWDALREAVEQFRHSREPSPKFGNWAGEINRLDPFRDGHADLRIGSFIADVHRLLDEGLDKHAALEQASDRFAERWGHACVSFGPPARPEP